MKGPNPEKSVKLIKNTRNGSIRAIYSESPTLKDYESEYSLKVDEKLSRYTQDVERTPGERWMVYGPLSYIPPVQVEVVEKVCEIPLDKNDGIYVRNIRTGDVRAVIGEPYMLTADE